MDRKYALDELGPDEAAEEVFAARGDQPAWLDAFTRSLETRRSVPPLIRLLRVWGLNRAEVGRMFGVSRQAVVGWVEQGIPAERRPAFADLDAATDLLVAHLRYERIPAVVRRPAPALGGASLLDLTARGDTAGVLAACREMFAFGAHP